MYGNLRHALATPASCVALRNRLLSTRRPDHRLTPAFVALALKHEFTQPREFEKFWADGLRVIKSAFEKLPAYIQLNFAEPIVIPALWMSILNAICRKTIEGGYRTYDVFGIYKFLIVIRRSGVGELDGEWISSHAFEASRIAWGVSDAFGEKVDAHIRARASYDYHNEFAHVQFIYGKGGCWTPEKVLFGEEPSPYETGREVASVMFPVARDTSSPTLQIALLQMQYALTFDSAPKFPLTDREKSIVRHPLFQAAVIRGENPLQFLHATPMPQDMDAAQIARGVNMPPRPNLIPALDDATAWIAAFTFMAFIKFHPFDEGEEEELHFYFGLEKEDFVNVV